MSEPTIHFTPAEALSKSAIGYVLARIRDDARLAYYFLATESHARLISAYAVLAGKSEDVIKDAFNPPATKSPGEAAEESPACSQDISDMISGSDVIDYLECLDVFDRGIIIHDIRARFCQRCFGDQGPAALPCQCRVGNRFKRGQAGVVL